MVSPLLNQLLDPRLIALSLRGTTAAEAVLEIIQLLRENGELRNAQQFFDAVMEREEKSSTVANGGIAFPHARTGLVDQLLLGIGRSEPGVQFAGANEPVHLIFLIAVPQQMVNDYLICVGALARLLHDPSIRDGLMKASTPAEFIEQLRSGG